MNAASKSCDPVPNAISLHSFCKIKRKNKFCFFQKLQLFLHIQELQSFYGLLFEGRTSICSWSRYEYEPMR